MESDDMYLAKPGKPLPGIQFIPGTDIPVPEGPRVTFNDNSTVTDSNGNTYPYSVSPLSDESVMGFRDDKRPSNGQQGVVEMLTVTRLLEEAGIPCCIVHERALIYYGAGRLALDWALCVPTNKLDQAADVIRAHPEDYIPFRRSAMTQVEGLDHIFPRFKCVGLALFFVILSTRECHLPCALENIERSHTGIPYPKLSDYAQSLLDSFRLVDLDDLVDGMNLTEEWGDENLDLEGSIDIEWAEWRNDILRKDGKYSMDMSMLRKPGILSRPMRSKREIWEETVRGKRRRQGYKYEGYMETRFFRKGSSDPRSRNRVSC